MQNRIGFFSELEFDNNQVTSIAQYLMQGEDLWSKNMQVANATYDPVNIF